ncbi:hypothetical protein ACFL39_00050 [Gemmatimonadota bacterium]
MIFIRLEEKKLVFPIYLSPEPKSKFQYNEDLIEQIAFDIIEDIENKLLKEKFTQVYL